MAGAAARPGDREARVVCFDRGDGPRRDRSSGVAASGILPPMYGVPASPVTDPRGAPVASRYRHAGPGGRGLQTKPRTLQLNPAGSPARPLPAAAVRVWSGHRPSPATRTGGVWPRRGRCRIPGAIRFVCLCLNVSFSEATRELARNQLPFRSFQLIAQFLRLMTRPPLQRRACGKGSSRSRACAQSPQSSARGRPARRRMPLEGSPSYASSAFPTE